MKSCVRSSAQRLWLSSAAITCWLLAGSAALAQLPTIPPLPPTAPEPAGNKNDSRLSPSAPSPVATAQPGGAKPATAASANTAKSPAKKSEMEVKNLELMTKDGMKIRAFYFPSEAGKEAVPVIIVHEWQGQGSPYIKLVKSLWNAGCAVIVPEYRGHGGSRSIEMGGIKKDFDLARMNRADVAKIIGADLEAVKKFLKEENNEKKLNLNALTLVGIREGGILAAHWAIADLNFPSVGQLKQGQDVKAMVMVSPEKILKGFSLDETLNDRLLWQLPFLVVVGRTSPQAAEADRYVKRLEAIKKRAAQGAVKGLDLFIPNTSVAGPNLVNDVPGVIEKITAFVKNEVISQSASYPWIDRTK